MAKDKSKLTDKMPARKMPEGFKMAPKATVKATTKPAAKATAKATSKAKPTAAELREAKAMKDLMAKRKAVAKKTGSWPNYNTN